jgi:hypothetical protein
VPTVSEQKVSLEIISKMPMLFIGRLPLIPKKTKNRILINATKKLSKQSFLISVTYLVNMIELDKNESQKYKDTWQEVYAMVQGEFSMFYNQRVPIYERVKAHRQKYSLPI